MDDEKVYSKADLIRLVRQYRHGCVDGKLDFLAFCGIKLSPHTWCADEEWAADVVIEQHTVTRVNRSEWNRYVGQSIDAPIASQYIHHIAAGNYGAAQGVVREVVELKINGVPERARDERGRFLKRSTP